MALLLKMKVMDRIFIWLLLIVVIPFNFLNSQQTAIVIGTALSKPDTRTEFLLENWPNRVVERIKNDDPSLDNEFFVAFSYDDSIKQSFSMSYSLGLAFNHNDFSLPINNRSYFEDLTKPLYVNDWYINANLFLNFEPKYKVNKLKKVELLIGLSNVISLSYYKLFYNSFNMTNEFDKFQLNLHSYELFPSIESRFRKVSIIVDYRLFNLKYRDPAIANNGKLLDLVNPIKFRFRISYFLS